MVQVVWTLKGDIDEYAEGSSARTTIASAVAAAAGVPPSSVAITVLAASVRLYATITPAAGQSTAALSSAISSSLGSAAAASAAFGATVESAATVTITTSGAAEQAITQAPSGQPTGPVPPEDSSLGVFVAAAAGGGALVLLVVTVMFYRRRRAIRAKDRATKATGWATADSTTDPALGAPSSCPNASSSAASSGAPQTTATAANSTTAVSGEVAVIAPPSCSASERLPSPLAGAVGARAYEADARVPAILSPAPSHSVATSPGKELSDRIKDFLSPTSSSPAVAEPKKPEALDA